jgi:nitrogen-specific signal transduction histidine kinase/HD-like signal output (HDOD) protein
MNSIDHADQSYDLSRLPAAPHILVQLLDLCHQEDAGFELFAEIISKDAGLTARILQIANSPAFRQWKDITDLRRVLIVFGMRDLKTIVTTCAVEQFFSQFSTTFNHQVRRIWIRSICCANLCERLAHLLGYHKPGEAFLAGLLYQSGMLILMGHGKEEYLQLLDNYSDAPNSFAQNERAMLGTDHCEVGAHLAHSWHLDSFLADAIRFQGSATAELRSAPVLLKILAVSASFAGSRNLLDNPSGLAKTAELFGLTADTTLGCLNQALEKSSSMFRSLGITEADTLLTQQPQSTKWSQDDGAAVQLGEAVRRITLAQLASPDPDNDLQTFARQIRISFCSIFPLKKLLLMRYDSNRSQLIPVNDLGYHQLDELTWQDSDAASLIVAALNSGTEQTLAKAQGSIADQQLLRLLDSSTITLIPLIHQNTKLGLIALGFDQGQSALSSQDRSLMTLFSAEIARRQDALNKTLGGTGGLSAEEVRQLVHEISNPLSIINNYLYVLGKKMQQDGSAPEEIQTISEEIERIGRILLHAKGQHPISHSPEKTDINALIDELDHILSNSLYSAKRIESTLQLDSNLPPLHHSADKLKQVLINLLKNAVEAIDQPGNITIFTRDNIYQEEQSFVEITIKDNGPGIPPAILQKLFSPVISTKDGHSGLGLVIVNKLIKELGGSISCFSNAAHGTEFKILLPRKTA